MAAKAQPLPVGRVIYAPRYSELGQLTAITPTQTDIQFVCISAGYYYNYASGGKPELHTVTKGDRVSLRLTWSEAVDAIFTGAGAYSLAKEFSKFSREAGVDVSPEIALDAGKSFGERLLAFGSGVGLGVWLGLEEPDCGSDAFRNLLDKESFWGEIYSRYVDVHSAYLTYDSAGIPALDKERGAAPLIWPKNRADVLAKDENKENLDDLFDGLNDYPGLIESLRASEIGYVPWFWICENQVRLRDSRGAWHWEDALRNWAPQHGPIAARILISERGQVTVSLRQWRQDRQGRFGTSDFKSSPLNREDLETELKALGWSRPTKESAIRLESVDALNTNF